MRRSDVEGFFWHNVAVTRGIHRASGNGTLQTLLGRIEKQSIRYRYLAHLYAQEMLDLSMAGQRTVVQAIEMRRPALARSRAIRLMRYAHSVIARTLADTVRDEPPLERPRAAPRVPLAG